MKKSVTRKGSAAVVTAVMLAYACLFCAGTLTHSARGVDMRESEFCLWEDGTQSLVAYPEAIARFCGFTEAGNFLLRGEEMRGEILSSAAAKKAISILEGPDLAAIFTLHPTGLSPLECALFNLRYYDRLYYADGFYTWENGALPTSSRRARELFVFGDLPASVPSDTGASVLHVAATASFTSLTVHGFSVMTAEAPYQSDGDALYLTTVGGTRLLTAAADRVSLILKDYDFADRGALFSCASLSELSLPFVGTSRELLHTGASGYLADLFSDGLVFRVPGTLKRVTVRGGKLIAHAFYACGGVEEVVACGMDADNIDREAFLDLNGLRLLHTPRSDVRLQGEFTAEKLACGCTLYRRAE